MITIQLNNVTKSYSGPDWEHDVQAGQGLFSHRQKAMPEPLDRDLALDNVTLTIHRGETVSVIGPSGCGKSTLLRIIAGLMQPTSGEVLYDGRPVSEVPVDKRGIGIVFQDCCLIPHLESYDNIGFFDIVHRTQHKIPARIEHIAEVMNVEIKYLLRRKPPQLSGGERQRVAIAHCLARDPKLFLFDEPLSNVDAKLRVSIRSNIKRLLDYYHITSVYVTHDQMEAIALSERIIVMNAGRIEQTGPYHRLYDAPANAFVAGFLGNPPMNLFEGYFREQSWHGKSFTIESLPHRLGEEKEILLGIRPEHIQIEMGGFPATVEGIDKHFSERAQVLHLRLNETFLAARTGIDLSVHPGETLPIRFPNEHLAFFDQTSGKRLGVRSIEGQ
ncbi:MAG: ABC transporter ATP-binding protein [Anaerolineae bacterium]|nr:ABC transporter ATP-binding protein [Anaerolineae bacterium]